MKHQKIFFLLVALIVLLNAGMFVYDLFTAKQFYIHYAASAVILSAGGSRLKKMFANG